jgi:hypothetical protein
MLQSTIAHYYLPDLDVLVPYDLLEDVARGVALVLEAELERAHVVHGRARDRPPPDLYPVEPLDASGGGVGRRDPVALLGGSGRGLRLVRARRRRVLRRISTDRQLGNPPSANGSEVGATDRLGGSAAERG